jgi:ABC-type nitrate/sulfonate/bicarbonate transport system permease component
MRGIIRAAVALVLPVAVVLAWWATSAGSHSAYYPPLRQVLSTFHHTWLFARFGSDVVPGLKRLLLGYALGIASGALLGVVLGRVRLLGRALNPAVQFGRAIPGAALVPIGVIVLGAGDVAKIMVIGFICSFPVLLNTIDAVRAVEPQLEEVSRSFHLTPVQRLTSVLLPSAGPRIFSGMRVSLQLAFVMMVITEEFSSTNGVGYVTLNAEQSFNIPLMWSGMLLLGLLGVTANGVLMLIQHRVLRWHAGLAGNS